MEGMNYSVYEFPLLTTYCAATSDVWGQACPCERLGERWRGSGAVALPYSVALIGQMQSLVPKCTLYPSGAAA